MKTTNREAPRWEELERAGEWGSMRTDIRPFCPTCGAELTPSRDHCLSCGQAIDWEVNT